MKGLAILVHNSAGAAFGGDKDGGFRKYLSAFDPPKLMDDAGMDEMARQGLPIEKG